MNWFNKKLQMITKFKNSNKYKLSCNSCSYKSRLNYKNNKRK